MEYIDSITLYRYDGLVEFPIGELARQAGVTRRTIRYYVEVGLLPPPSGAGRASVYGAEHLRRLELVKQLQGYRLSLEEIRDRLAMEPEAEWDAGAHVLAVLPPPPAFEERPLASIPPSASDYVRQIREQMEMAALPGTARERPRLEGYSTEQWLRIVLAPDVELHVRRRGTRTDRRLARLIKEARRILEEEGTQ